MKTVMRLAGVYNILWGAWVCLFPLHFFTLTGMEPINHIVIWQVTARLHSNFEVHNVHDLKSHAHI